MLGRFLTIGVPNATHLTLNYISNNNLTMTLSRKQVIFLKGHRQDDMVTTTKKTPFHLYPRLGSMKKTTEQPEATPKQLTQKIKQMSTGSARHRVSPKPD